LSLLDRKIAAPLERIALDRPFTDALNASESPRQGAIAYSNAVQAANVLITAKKAATGTAQIRAVEAALGQLQAVKARHRPTAIAACQVYETANNDKTIKESEKAAARVKLDEHTKQVIGLYEKTVFALPKPNIPIPVACPAPVFKILINEIPVELGDAGTPLDKQASAIPSAPATKARSHLRFFSPNSNMTVTSRAGSLFSTTRSIARTPFGRITLLKRSGSAAKGVSR
jgi:hypothetical protein